MVKNWTLSNSNWIPGLSGVGAALKLMLVKPAARICGRNRFNLTRLAVLTDIKQPQFCAHKNSLDSTVELSTHLAWVCEAFDRAHKRCKLKKRKNCLHFRIVQHPAHRMPFVVIPRDNGSGKPSASRMQWAFTRLRMFTVKSFTSFTLVHINSLPFLLPVTPLFDFADHRTHQKLCDLHCLKSRCSIYCSMSLNLKIL